MNALAEAEAEGIAPDYVILLSGACLPCRPVAQLERYLAENAGTEFIEVRDDTWMIGGWRSERWRYRFWFDHKTQHPAEWLFFQIQRLLGIERRFPAGLTPRFGSQWWALTWDTARAMLIDMRRAPRRLRFFRSVWIPDEMVVQTYVHALVPADDIAGHGLTHFQFSNRGKPIVFHDDHVDYVRTLNGFFLRKAAPGAARLRAACLAVARGADDGAPLAAIGTRRDDYRVKVAAQTYYPAPGQIFYGDQQADMTDFGPRPPPRPLCGARRSAGADPGGGGVPAGIALHLPRRGLRPGEVDLGPSGRSLGGLGRGDAAIRDLHPALFLARLRARCPRCRCSPGRRSTSRGSSRRCCATRRALVVACLPFTGDDPRATGRSWRSPAGPRGHGAGARERARRHRRRSGRRGRWPTAWRRRALADWLGRDLFDLMQDGPQLQRSACIGLPWSLGSGHLGAPQRRRLFEDLLARSRFASHHWFRGLSQALRRAWDERLESDAARLLGPLPGLAGLLDGGARRRSARSRRRARAACARAGAGAGAGGRLVIGKLALLLLVLPRFVALELAGPRRRAAARAGAGPPRPDRARRHHPGDLPAQRAGADTGLRRPLPQARGGAFPGDRQRLDRRFPRMGGRRARHLGLVHGGELQGLGLRHALVNDLLRRHAKTAGAWWSIRTSSWSTRCMETRDLARADPVSRGRPAARLHALLLDAYSDRPLGRRCSGPGDDPFAICPVLRPGRLCATGRLGQRDLDPGGPRMRAHFRTAPARRRRSTDSADPLESAPITSASRRTTPGRGG